MESLLLALVGGVFGCALALPLNGMTTGIGSFVTFSEIALTFALARSRCSWNRLCIDRGRDMGILPRAQCCAQRNSDCAAGGVSMQATSQAPVVEQENAMDAGLKSLRIDRSSKQTGRAAGRSLGKMYSD